MYDQMLAIYDIWLRLVKDGLVKNHDSVTFATFVAGILDRKWEPTYDNALTILYPQTCISDRSY